METWQGFSRVPVTFAGLKHLPAGLKLLNKKNGSKFWLHFLKNQWINRFDINYYPNYDSCNSNTWAFMFQKLNLFYLFCQDLLHVNLDVWRRAEEKSFPGWPKLLNLVRPFYALVRFLRRVLPKFLRCRTKVVTILIRYPTKTVPILIGYHKKAIPRLFKCLR